MILKKGNKHLVHNQDAVALFANYTVSAGYVKGFSNHYFSWQS